MPTPLAWLRRRALALSRETALAPLQHRTRHPRSRGILEGVIHNFVDGYSAALELEDDSVLAAELDQRDASVRGFAYEGAGMALRLSDALTLGASRWARFTRGAGAPHVYLLCVGAGFALARLHRRPESLATLGARRLWPLAIDGWGFHEGFFHAQRSIEARAVPRGLESRELEVFDSGLGRSFWFFAGADVERVVELADSLAAERRPGLWAGVGLACAYAGGVELGDVRKLFGASRTHSAHFAQGVAFAVAARHRARNAWDWTTAVGREVWGAEGDELGALVDGAFERSDGADVLAAYGAWRALIRSRFEARTPGHALVG
jgi:hypothetical protein